MSQNVKTLLSWGVAELKSVINQSAATDARILMAHVLGLERSQVSVRLDDMMSDGQRAQYQTLITQRKARQPIAQIIGRREFWGRNFVVTSDVLDPRPDTETLIETALTQEPATRILDLGTGSGCILLTLLAEWPTASGVGVDLSDDALNIAQQNANRLAVTERVSLVQSDWFSNVTGRFDLIVSNPPYIREDDMVTLEPEVRDWEPKLALTPGSDGLAAYRIIAENFSKYLMPNGRLLLEIGWHQAQDVMEIFSRFGNVKLQCLKDLGGNDRVMLIKRDFIDKNNV